LTLCSFLCLYMYIMCCQCQYVPTLPRPGWFMGFAQIRSFLGERGKWWKTDWQQTYRCTVHCHSVLHIHDVVFGCSGGASYRQGRAYKMQGRSSVGRSSILHCSHTLLSATLRSARGVKIP